MQALGGAEFRAAEGMGDHDVINNGQAEHGRGLSCAVRRFMHHR
jgi:hypothetical protein